MAAWLAAECAARGCGVVALAMATGGWRNRGQRPGCVEAAVGCSLYLVHCHLHTVQHDDDLKLFKRTHYRDTRR